MGGYLFHRPPCIVPEYLIYYRCCEKQGERVLLEGERDAYEFPGKGDGEMTEAEYWTEYDAIKAAIRAGNYPR